MPIFKKIMVAYDGSPHSKKALTKAAELMNRDSDAEMHIVSVTPPPSMDLYSMYGLGLSQKVMDEYNELAQKTMTEAEEFMAEHKDSCQFVRLQGNASQTIIEYADKQKFDLIILGSRGLGAFKGMLLGSVSHHVVTHADSHVLVIK